MKFYIYIIKLSKKLQRVKLTIGYCVSNYFPILNLMLQLTLTLTLTLKIIV